MNAAMNGFTNGSVNCSINNRAVLHSMRGVAYVLITATATVGNFSAANENQLHWSLGSRYEFDSNPLLREVDPEKISGVVVSPRATYAHETETSKLSMGINTDIRRYDESAFDGYDYGFNISRISQREVNATQWMLSIRDEQIRNTDIDFNGDLLASDDRRATDTLNGSWQHYVNERYSLVLDGNYQQVAYDGDGYADYDYSGVGISWNTQHSAIFSTLIRLNYSEFNSTFESTITLQPLPIKAPTSVNTATATIALNLGFDWQLSEKFSWQLSLGSSGIDNEQQSSRPFLTFQDNQLAVGFFEQEYLSDGEQYLLDSRLSYQGETSTYNLAANVGTGAGGTGSLSKTSSLDLSAVHQLLERMRFNWGISFKRRESVDENLLSSSNDSQRDYYTAYMALSHQMARAWVVSTSLRYVTQHQAKPEYTPEAGIALVTFTYSPQTITW